MSVVVEAAGLTKHYGPLVAVDDLSFRLRPGTVTGFLGPNGAGKTTTLRMMLGLVAPTGGTARFGDRGYADLADPLRTVGTVLEQSTYHPARTARNHLRVLARSAGLPLARVEECLAQVGLEPVGDRKVGAFSLGMRQRLGLAAALLGDPAVLLLDEPANGLDPEGMRWLRGFLRHLADQRRTILLSSHVLAEVAQTADHVIIIARGRLVQAGPVGEVMAAAGSGVRVRTPDAERLVAALRAAGLPAQRTDDVVVADGAEPLAVGRIMAEHGIVVVEMSAGAANLEEVFLELTEEPEGAPA